MRLLIGLALLLTACASHDVRCDGRLQPINQPAPHAQPAQSSVLPPPSMRPETSGRGVQ
jgi:hypothetical protein